MGQSKFYIDGNCGCTFIHSEITHVFFFSKFNFSKNFRLSIQMGLKNLRIGFLKFERDK